MREIAIDAGSESQSEEPPWMTEDTPDEMTQIAPENRTHVTLSAEVGASELSVPRKQYLAEQAEQFEKLFAAEAWGVSGDRSTPSQGERFLGGIPSRPQDHADRLVMSHTVDVRHLDADETEQVMQKAVGFEERFHEKANEYNQ